MQVRIYIKGVVTGVFFRKNAKEQADRGGLTGWIRNVYDQPDIFGASPGVEVVLQGSKEQIDTMIAWLYKGSPLSHVEKVVVEKEEERKTFDTFEIIQ